MDIDPDTIRRHPLLGPLLAVPPQGVVLDGGAFREPGKRVRLRVLQVLRRKRGLWVLMGEIRSATGLELGEISVALSKLRHAGEVEVVDRVDGTLKKGYRCK